MTSISQSRSGRLAVVTFDWLPAWMLTTWGTTWLATPAFDALAAKGITFDNVLAAGDDLATTLNAVVGPASEVAQRRQVASLLVTDADDVARGPLGRRFRDVLVEPAVPAEHTAEEEADTALGELFATAVEAVPALAEEPCWLWCHAGSLGVVWDAPLALRDSLRGEDDPEPPRSAVIPSCVVAADDDPDRVLGVRQAFAGQVMLADRMLGFLLEMLEGLEGEPWTMVVAGLRGMPLGLHGTLGIPADGPPQLLPYGDLVQMPVIVADAGGRMAGQRYGGLLAADDLGRFLRGCLAGHDEAGLEGLLTRWACTPRERIVSTTRAGLSLATPEWRMVVKQSLEADADESAATELFAKPDDYFEQVDVADRCGAVADDLLEQLKAEASGPQAAPKH